MRNVKNSGPPNLNSAASNLNYMARSFYEMPRSFFAVAMPFFSKASVSFSTPSFIFSLGIWLKHEARLSHSSAYIVGSESMSMILYAMLLSGNSLQPLPETDGIIAMSRQLLSKFSRRLIVSRSVSAISYRRA